MEIQNLPHRIHTPFYDWDDIVSCIDSNMPESEEGRKMGAEVLSFLEEFCSGPLSGQAYLLVSVQSLREYLPYSRMAGSGLELALDVMAKIEPVFYVVF